VSEAEKQYALGPDGRIVDFDPHHDKLKPGWRMATQEDIDAKLASLGLLPAPSPPAEEAPVIHESVIELTSE
jgi:hypothetical protein